MTAAAGSRRTEADRHLIPIAVVSVDIEEMAGLAALDRTDVTRDAVDPARIQVNRG